MRHSFVAVRAALYASGFVLLWGWLAAAVRRFDGPLGGPLPGWLRPVGLALALAGGSLALWCVAEFVRSGQGTPVPFDAPRRFVAGGAYRWVRNPMYLGALSLLGGVGVWLRSPAIALLALAGLGLAHGFVVLYEEPALGRRFGPPYARYRQRVNRWVPRRPANGNGHGGAARR